MFFLLASPNPILGNLGIAIYILPSLGIDEGQFVWRDADHGSILIVEIK
jgi:hypothetical protein